MKKQLLLPLAAAIGMLSASAETVTVDETISTYWQSLDGKYITITGARPVANGQYNQTSTIPVIGRSVTDTENADGKLRLMTNYSEPNKYWTVEYDAENNGLILCNAVTGKYFGPMRGNSQHLPLQTEKANAGIARAFVHVQGTETIKTQYIITTTKVGDAVNTAFNADNNTYDTGSVNTPKTNAVWLFCPQNSELASNYGAPNGNSHWEISAFTPEEALRDFTLGKLKIKFAAATETSLNKAADQILAGLDESLTSFSEKAAAVVAALDDFNSVYSYAPLATSEWAGKYIVITGTSDDADNMNKDRSMIDAEDLVNLSVQRNFVGPNKYWQVELDDTYGGAYLKNTVTDRYIGTVGKSNNTVIPMQAEKSDEAGVVMIYPRNNVLFVTTTKIRDNGNLIDNPNICHGDNPFLGYANFDHNANTDNQTKLWMFCTDGSKTDTDVHPVKNYGNGNPNGYWAVRVLSEAEMLTELAVESIKAKHSEWLTDEDEINYWADQVGSAVAGLSDLTLNEKFAKIEAETASKRYLAEELDGKKLLFGTTDASLSTHRIANNNGTLAFPVNSVRANSVWTATYNETEDGVTLKNGDYYLAQMPTSNGGAFSLTADADKAGCYRLYKFGLSGDYCITCTRLTNDEAVNPIGRFGGYGNTTGFWIQAKADNGGKLARWGSNPASSKWTFAFDNSELEEATVLPVAELTFDDEHHGIRISHADGLLKHHNLLYEAQHVITVQNVTAQTENIAPQSDEVYTISHSNLTVGNDGSLNYSLGLKLPAGNYKINVPQGMFLVGENQNSKATSATYTVSASGSSTGIEELAASAALETAIYDLQGRRLAVPAHGLNIINGKKVLVK